MKIACLVLSFLALSVGPAISQSGSNDHKAPSVWNIHTRDVTTLRAPQSDPIAVLTPTQPIVVRRIEALSIRGPVSATASAEPTACPLPFSLDITNGSETKSVPISTAFLKKGSGQTYTDTGSLNLPFAAGSRIAVALVVPAAGFPPTSCVLNGLNISIQFESAGATHGKSNWAV